jgi:hypothetical protein
LAGGMKSGLPGKAGRQQSDTKNMDCGDGGCRFEPPFRFLAGQCQEVFSPVVYCDSCPGTARCGYPYALGPRLAAGDIPAAFNRLFPGSTVGGKAAFFLAARSLAPGFTKDRRASRWKSPHADMPFSCSSCSCGWLAADSVRSPRGHKSAAARASTRYLLIWLVGWTLGGLFAVSILLWMLLGGGPDPAGRLLAPGRRTGPGSLWPRRRGMVADLDAGAALLGERTFR